MNAIELQRLAYRDKFRSVHRNDFETWFGELARALHPTGDFQLVRATQGDGGIDGFSINAQHVYQTFAPGRIDEFRDSETAEKIRWDFRTAFATLGGKMRGWVFVHNHPEGKLGQLSIAAINDLKSVHPDVEIAVWDIDALWAKLALLSTREREKLLPSKEGEANYGLGGDATDRIRHQLIAPGGDFAVPVLDVRLPLAEAWDRLHWSSKPSPSGEGQLSLSNEIHRYYEWARLARTNTATDFAASVLLGRGQRTVILGGPGSGKSTLSRKLAWQAAGRGEAVWRVSLRIIARLIERGSPFAEALQISAQQEAGIGTEQLPKSTPPIFLIADGLDEAEPNRLLVAEALHAWARANPSATVIVTSRPIGHAPRIMPEFATTELLPLTEKATGELARLMLQRRNARPEQIEAFIELILPTRMWSRRTKSAAMIASRSPLLLSFLVALYQDGQSITGRRAELYSAIIHLCRRSPVNDRLVRPDLPAPILDRGLDALEILATMAAANLVCLCRLLARYGQSHMPDNLLVALLKLPRMLLAQGLEEIVGLRRSPSPESRLNVMKMLLSLPLTVALMKEIATEGLRDEHAPVRDAATVALRTLAEPSR